MCDDWFHARCINMAIQDAQKLESYVCPNCKIKQANKKGARTTAISLPDVAPVKKRREEGKQVSGRTMTSQMKQTIDFGSSR